MATKGRDLLDGRQIKAHKEKWAVLKYFGYGVFLAVKSDSDFPKQVYLVREDDKK